MLILGKDAFFAIMTTMSEAITDVLLKAVPDEIGVQRKCSLEQMGAMSIHSCISAIFNRKTANL